MADDPTIFTTTIDEIFAEDEDLTPEEELAGAQDALEAEDALDALDERDSDYTVTIEPPPQPLGRSWRFDFAAESFVMHGHGPLATYGLQTLMGWAEKAIRTQAGAHPIHPPEYGMRKALGDYFGQSLDDSNDLNQLEQDVEDCLTFHPAITSIEDFEVGYGTSGDGDDTAAGISLTIILDDGTDAQFQTVLADGEVVADQGTPDG